MKSIKTLHGIVLVTGILSLGGCGYDASDYARLEYSGKIGNEFVSFLRFNSSWELTVKKPDGRIIKYGDSPYNNYSLKSLKLDYVEITKDPTANRYGKSTEAEIKILKEAQKQFYNYLDLIKDEKEKEIDVKKALEDLK